MGIMCEKLELLKPESGIYNSLPLSEVLLSMVLIANSQSLLKKITWKTPEINNL